MRVRLRTAKENAMRVVVQRVSQAQVLVVVGEIGRGVVVLVGFATGDSDDDAAWMARKIAGLRIFDDRDGLMNAALADVGGRVLAVSQFTLLGDVGKGRRPSFAGAMPSEHAAPLFDRFVAFLAEQVGPVAIGVFGARMDVRLVNDGPVTLIIERRA
jgi:D-tyrosyl-tRNA(Tyr) deacylase